MGLMVVYENTLHPVRYRLQWHGSRRRQVVPFPRPIPFPDTDWKMLDYSSSSTQKVQICHSPLYGPRYCSPLLLQKTGINTNNDIVQRKRESSEIERTNKCDVKREMTRAGFRRQDYPALGRKVDRICKTTMPP